MEELKEFLVSSTVHGIAYIPSTRRFSRLFWIFVVVGGLIGSICLIQQAFYNWNQSPISTTIESLPISELTYPNITVCPPKNSFLNLNYDIMLSENMKVGEDIRKELYEFALETIQNISYEDIMKNISKVKDPHRFYNWYHGYTKLDYPFHQFNMINYKIRTTATFGHISTQHFGEKFDADKVEENIEIQTQLSLPKSLERAIGNTSLILKINKGWTQEPLNQALEVARKMFQSRRQLYNHKYPYDF